MTKYVAKIPDSRGFIQYTDEENAVWATLYRRQSEIVKNRACDEYLAGLALLQLDQEKIPQLPDVNQRLKKATGWTVEPVPALISFDRFFDLLANRKFPAATFIRTPEELEYLQEPDIFHELFGHCPQLTDPFYADFVQKYGELGLKANEKDRVMLARLYWFTVEFGLIETAKGLRVYGGGILSSMGETPYSLESPIPIRKPLVPLEAFRTPYRIDIFQTVYFIIQKFSDLYDLMHTDLMGTIAKARELGMFAPTFPPKHMSDEFKTC